MADKEYPYDYWDRILPKEREPLIALIKFLFDYIEELERGINEES